MRRILIVAVSLALVVVLGWFVYQRVLLPKQTAANESDVETTEVIRGSIASTVSATGSIEPADEISSEFSHAWFCGPGLC